jgi:hypothetical protein
VLGLQVKTNAPYGPDERWLTVVSPEEPDGVELALHLADEPARAFQAASRAVGRPCCRCAPTTAPEGRAAQGQRRGIHQGTARMAYGSTDAVFADTDGNLINLHQD